MDVTICLKKPFKLSLDGTCRCAWRTSFPCETAELSVKCHRSTGDVSKIHFFQIGNDTHSKQLHDINKSHSVRRDYQVFAEPSTVLPVTIEVCERDGSSTGNFQNKRSASTLCSKNIVS